MYGQHQTSNGQRSVHGLCCVVIACVVSILLGATIPTAGAAGGKRSEREIRDNRISERLERVFPQGPVTAAGGPAATAARQGVRTSGERVVLDVVLHGPAPGLKRAIEAAGGVVRAISPAHHRASVEVADRAALNAIAALPAVQYVYPEYGPVRREGTAESRAPEAMRVDKIAPPLTGSGLTVGILGDSFARTDGVVDGNTTTDGTSISSSGNSSPVTLEGTKPQDSLDLLGTIELRRDDATGNLTDEGAAMAELIHDLAPGADLAFYTAFVSFAEFAAGIEDLCGPAGADVVVDDVLYLAESMYQRDVISRAARECVDNGVPFFSAAGNNGDRGFQEVYRDVDEIDTNEAGEADNFLSDFHDWNPDAGGDPLVRISLDDDESVRVVLQWNQPALSVPENDDNGPRIDLDLYLLDSSGTIVDSSFQDQQANDSDSGADPIEVVEFANNSGSRRVIFLGVDHWAGSRDRIPQDEGTRLEFRLVLFESGTPSYEYTPDASTMYGHPVADGVISVGAVPWWEAPPFDPSGNGDTAGIDPEPFTALGGRLQQHFRPNGSFFRRTRDPQPSLAAVDANNTTFFGEDIDSIAGTEGDTHPNFFGTSAAAPNAAAVAAILLEDDGSLDPDDIAAGLMASAKDVRGANASRGCDDLTGAGLIDAKAAVGARDRKPRARAGDDQSTKSGRTVTLDGSESRDNNGIDAFRWTQVEGKRVSLSNASGAQTDFEAPGSGGDLVFELRVTDAACLSDSDRVTVEVEGNGGGGGGGGIHPGLLLGFLLILRIRMRRT